MESLPPPKARASVHTGEAASCKQGCEVSLIEVRNTRMSAKVLSRLLSAMTSMHRRYMHRIDCGDEHMDLADREQRSPCFFEL